MSCHTATRRRELLTRRALVVVEDVVHIIEVVFVRHDVFLHAKASLAARRGRKWCVASEGEGDETTELSMRVVFNGITRTKITTTSTYRPLRPVSRLVVTRPEP